MAEFKRRCLYKITTPNEPNIPEIYESIWAYSIQYKDGSTPTPGRYRIRITKMSGADLVAMINNSDAEEGTSVDFSIQAYVEKWTSTGWIHALDWIGDPALSPAEIENELNEMYAAFTTGEPVGKDYQAPVYPRSPNKPPKKKSPPNKRAEPHPKSEDSSGDDPFGWI